MDISRNVCCNGDTWKERPSSSNTNILLTFVNSACKLYLVIGSSSSIGDISMSLHTWHSALYTFQCDPSISKTNTKLFLDLVLDKEVQLAGKLMDNVNGHMSIWQEYDGYALSDFFKGYIWQVKLYNYAISLTEYQTEVFGPGQPASTSFQLSVCGQNQYITSTGACANCQTSCSYGCSSGLNCYFPDPLCTYCTTFESGSCVTCVGQASLVGGLCTCNSEYVYVSASPSTCVPCDVTCLACQDIGSTQCLVCKGLLL